MRNLIYCRSPHQFWNALLHFNNYTYLFKSSRSPHQFWNALLPMLLMMGTANLLSQSPSILECSPTKVEWRSPMTGKVAVPINSGMLSYVITFGREVTTKCRSPHQFWNALLRASPSWDWKRKLSQSPSILECSPTYGGKDEINRQGVAVPINSGMLSYLSILWIVTEIIRRSPHQFWNALLPRLYLNKTPVYGRSPHQFWNALLQG